MVKQGTGSAFIKFLKNATPIPDTLPPALSTRRKQQAQANSSEILSLGNEGDEPWNPRVPKTQFQRHQLNNVNGFKATEEIKMAMVADLC